MQTRELTPSRDPEFCTCGSASWGVPPWGRGRGSWSSPRPGPPHMACQTPLGAPWHTTLRLLAEDGALPQCRAVPAARCGETDTRQAHLRAFSYGDDGVGPALADRPLSGARPGILLQMMLAPRATTEEKPLEQGTQRDGALGQQGAAAHSLQTLPGCQPASPTAPIPGLSASDTARPAHIRAFVISHQHLCIFNIRHNFLFRHKER